MIFRSVSVVTLGRSGAVVWNALRLPLPLAAIVQAVCCAEAERAARNPFPLFIIVFPTKE